MERGLELAGEQIDRYLNCQNGEPVVLAAQINRIRVGLEAFFELRERVDLGCKREERAVPRLEEADLEQEIRTSEVANDIKQFLSKI